MKATKIKIKNLFGIEETELNGDSVEITGKNGAGKTSIIDAIRYALTNKSNRDYLVRDGAREGEIYIETDVGISIDRKKRTDKSDYKSIRNNGAEISSPESFLQQMFTPLQLNPVEFVQMSRQEQNRRILDLIQYDWNMETIKGWFGEIPTGVNYDQNILQVLHEIQADDGDYFVHRQDVNREVRTKKAFVEDIQKDIPAGYDAEYWERYDTSAKYAELIQVQRDNGMIEKAKAFLSNLQNKIRGIEADREIQTSALERSITSERENLGATIARLEAEIVAAKEKLGGLYEKFEANKKVIDAEFEAKKAKVASDADRAQEYAAREVKLTDGLQAEIDKAEAMKKHLNEYKRMQAMISDIDELHEESEELTRKIELARELPGQILMDATLPIKGLTVENGIPLVNGLPVSNLSEGEQLSLCVDVAVANPNSLSLILLDGTEKLSEENRKKLYEKCKSVGLQFIATRTTDDSELIITNL